MTMQTLAPETPGVSIGRPARIYLMCPPVHFDIQYAINARHRAVRDRPVHRGVLPGRVRRGRADQARDAVPYLIEATEADALAVGLNSVSDGRHVIVPHDAVSLRVRPAEAGYEVLPVEMTELRKAGGGPKCCTLELRP